MTGFAELLFDCSPTAAEILGSGSVLDRLDVEVRDHCLRALTSMTAAPNVLTSATRRTATTN